MFRSTRSVALIVAAAGFVGLAPAGYAQAPAAPAAPQGGRGNQAPSVVSQEVSADRKITFRISAPQAQAVRLAAGDIPGVGQATQLTKGDNGVWEATVGPVEPGAYRYSFNVDGVTTIDPATPFTSESNTRVWSVVYVPGADNTDTRNVPHGGVAAVTYYSTTLKAFRRMHVYMPPGYETGTGKYPVFYLLHGAGDSDDSWTSVGRASFILDNLIADKKAKPMVVVMPAGHTSRTPHPEESRDARLRRTSSTTSRRTSSRMSAPTTVCSPIAPIRPLPDSRWAATTHCRLAFRSSRSSLTSVSTAPACLARSRAWPDRVDEAPRLPPRPLLHPLPPPRPLLPPPPHPRPLRPRRRRRLRSRRPNGSASTRRSSMMRT
jgi:Putative esterase/Carbohydrate-binding module 48 (Isoamylase N-terminal domain)